MEIYLIYAALLFVSFILFMMPFLYKSSTPTVSESELKKHHHIIAEIAPDNILPKNDENINLLLAHGFRFKWHKGKIIYAVKNGIKTRLYCVDNPIACGADFILDGFGINTGNGFIYTSDVKTVLKHHNIE